jgi:hypothetical protein
MEQNDYMSLYDFLGKPAGGELGKQVATKASNLNIKILTRDISNPKYTGKIMLYPKSFLELYFKVQTNTLPF